MNGFVRVNDTEIIGIGGNINYVYKDTDPSRNHVRVCLNGKRDLIFHLDNGGYELWDYFCYHALDVKAFSQHLAATEEKYLTFLDLAVALKSAYPGRYLEILYDEISITFSTECLRWVKERYDNKKISRYGDLIKIKK